MSSYFSLLKGRLSLGAASFWSCPPHSVEFFSCSNCLDCLDLCLSSKRGFTYIHLHGFIPPTHLLPVGYPLFSCRMCSSPSWSFDSDGNIPQAFESASLDCKISPVKKVAWEQLSTETWLMSKGRFYVKIRCHLYHNCLGRCKKKKNKQFCERC